MNLTPEIPASTLSRRTFVRTAGKTLGLASLLGGLPRGWVGGAYAGEGPETSSLRCGIIALTDCSPFVIGCVTNK